MRLSPLGSHFRSAPTCLAQGSSSKCFDSHQFPPSYTDLSIRVDDQLCDIKIMDVTHARVQRSVPRIGSFLNYLNLIDCSFSTTNENDVI